MTDIESGPTDYSRRDALKRGGLVAGVAGAVWAAPSITTLGGAAFAQGSDPDLDGPFSLEALFDGTSTSAGPFTISAGVPLAANPGGYLGNPAVRSLEGGLNPAADSTFPAIAKNTTNVLQGAATASVPPNAVVVHPSNTGDGDIVVTFTPPTAASYTGVLTLTDIDAGGGNGIAYVFGTLTGNVPNGGSVTVSTSSASPVSLTVQNAGEYSFDSTRVQLVFTRNP